jgi:Flp pilus assembly pilin Flp
MKSSDVKHLLARSEATRDDRGQGLAEYALILGLIAIVAILSLIFLGDTIADLISLIGDTVD